jgi:hypothetical protein
MNGVTSSVAKAPAPVKSPKVFSYNAQDSDTLPGEKVTLNVSLNAKGLPSTDSVVLRPQTQVTSSLPIMLPDGKYRLTPNAEGEFVYTEKGPLLDGANSFSAIAMTTDKFKQEYKELTGEDANWAFKDAQIGVSPTTGETPNAFYARPLKGIYGFHYKTTSTSDSGEAMSHECGHALLDGVRPGYLQGSGPETGAFHEAFGDQMGMLMTLQNDQALEKLVAETGGDLSRNQNILSDCGEGFGAALGMEHGIRTSFNDFVYADPATLPEHGDATHLGREVHSLSRLWSAAFYDVLDGISDANRAAGMAPKEALRSAGDEAWKLVVGQLHSSPNNSETTFKEMAQHLLTGDAAYNGGKRQDVIRDAMVKRGLMDKDAAPTRLAPGMRMTAGEPTEQEFTFSQDAGQLAGVKMKTLVDQSAFGLMQNTDDGVAREAAKGAKLMVEDGKVLFTESAPSVEQLIAKGAFAYVAPNENGEKEFVRVPIAFE